MANKLEAKNLDGNAGRAEGWWNGRVSLDFSREDDATTWGAIEGYFNLPELRGTEQNSRDQDQAWARSTRNGLRPGLPEPGFPSLPLLLCGSRDAGPQIRWAIQARR